MNSDVKSRFNGLVDKRVLCYSSKNKHFIRRLKNIHKLVNDLTEEANILDIGCGTGEIISSIQERFGCNAIGNDISHKMIGHCNAKYINKRLRFEEGNILNLKYQTEHFDLVVSLSVIEWIENYERAIEEVSRVLKCNGQWIVSLPNWASPFRKMEFIRRSLQKNSSFKYHKNRILISEFIHIAKKYDLEVKQTIFHVLPLFSSNLKGFLGPLLGMMCILSMKKTC